MMLSSYEARPKLKKDIIERGKNLKVAAGQERH